MTEDARVEYKRIFPSIEIEGEESNALVTISIEESPVKPVFAFGRAYKRVGRANVVLSREEMLRLSDATRGSSWDALPCPGLRLEHLSRAAIEAYLKRAKQDIATPTETVLDTLRLRAGDTLFNAAALLFATEPYRWLDCTKVQCARFLGTEPIYFLDEQTYYDNVIAQIDAAEDFVARNTRSAIVITWRNHTRDIPGQIPSLRETGAT